MTLGSLVPALGFLDPIVQDNTLQREFKDAAFPELMYRMEAEPAQWEANVGDNKVFTRRGLLTVNTAVLAAGTDPAASSPSFEQWRVVAAQRSNRIDTHMPSSFVALDNVFMSNSKTLGLNAGQTLNRVTRDKLFSAYLGGDTVNTTSFSSTTAHVSNVGGFGYVLVNGELTPVSASNTLSVTIGSDTKLVTAAVADDPTNDPFGPGNLTLASNSTTYAAGTKIVAANASTIIRVGGAATVDGLTSGSLLRVQDIRLAVATLRRNFIPTHSDGTYHVHLDSISLSQLYADNEFQRLYQGLPDDAPYRDFIVSRFMNCTFYENNQSPNVNTVDGAVSTRGSAYSATGLGGEIYNTNGVPILRTIVTGGGALTEHWINEQAAYMTTAGFIGKIGNFNITNNAITVATDRIRYTVRAPIDPLGQTVTQSWSWSGDFGVPSDSGGGQGSARFKRAVVIESGANA